MKYVLDASVGIKWVMNEIDSAKARQLRDDFRSQIHDARLLNSLQPTFPFIIALASFP
jgi:hypothetical protein